MATTPTYNYWPDEDKYTATTTPLPPTPGESQRPAPSPRTTPSNPIAQAARNAVSQGARDNVSRFVDLLRASGVDPSDPRVKPYLDAIASFEPEKLGEYADTALNAFVLTVQEEVLGTSSWGQAVLRSGFAHYDIAQAQELGTGDLREGPPTGVPPWAEEDRYRTQPEVIGPYERHPQTGWWRYEAGVLVDPSEGAVYYDPTADAPGSLPWMNSARQTWSPEEVNSWRKTLVRLGYMEKGQEKGEWDVNFEMALAQYHQQRYLHGGEAVRYGLPEEGGGLDLNMRTLRGQIQNAVRQQFIQVFGDLPTEDELEHWTKFVIQTGNRLQRRRDMTPGAAAAEAEERMTGKIAFSDEAVFLNEQVQENTELRDAITRAIQATWRLSS